MSDLPDQERTEEATPKRREESRKKGQIPRSRDLTTFISLITAGVTFLFTAKLLTNTITRAFQQHLVLTREEIFETSAMFQHMEMALFAMIKMIAPISLCAIAAIFLASLMMGGWIFTTENLGVKFERINPLSGIKKIFSKRAFIELIKSLFKFVLVTTVGIFYIKASLPHILMLGNANPENAMITGLNDVLWGFLLITSSLLVIVFIDAPFQWWEHNQKLRMTKQEIKDEFKESEGSPETKQRVRRVQHEIANRKMMQELPKANVVITNPTHYAVAIRYDEGEQSAPIVVAKGVDSMAEQIRKIATEHNIMLVSAPPLARSLYHHTPLNKEIPVGLYVAVAQILAYVYQLKRYKRGEIKDVPMPLENLPIPEELVE